MDTDITETPPSPGEDLLKQRQILAIRLQRSIREKKLHEVKKFIKEKADVNYKDATGSSAIHYASQEGNLEIVNILIDTGAIVNTFDNNYHTPLHKAAMRGHPLVAVALVAAGAEVGALDWDNCSPFEKSIIFQHYKLSKILMLFGAHPYLKDRSWITDKLSASQTEVLETIQNEITLETGYRHGQILHHVAKIEPGTQYVCEQLGLVVDATKEKDAFFFFCRKLPMGFTDIKYLLANEDTVLSDMFEIQTWRFVRKTLRITIDIEGIPKHNEQFGVVSQDGNVGKIQDFEKLEEENITKITIDISLMSNNTTTFAIKSTQKGETFAISRGSQDISLISEPGAEIHLPSDAFKDVAELTVKVLDSNDANNDEEEATGPLVLTNVIDMTVSDGQQPQKELVIRLPLHYGDQEEQDVCVLATSLEEADDEKDWEVLEAETDSAGKTATFKINHLSVYAGAKKKNVRENKQEVVDVIQRSLSGTKKVIIRAFAREKIEDRVFSLVLECMIPRKLRKRKRKWELEGYQLVEPYLGPFVTPSNQTFRIRFSNNIEIVRVGNLMEEENSQSNENQEEGKKDQGEVFNVNTQPFTTLDFVGRAGYNFTVVNLKCKENKQIKEQVIVEKEVGTTEWISQTVTDPDSGCFRVKERTEKKKIPKLVYERLVDFPLSLRSSRKVESQKEDVLIPSEATEKTFQSILEDFEKTYPSTVPGMDTKTLGMIGGNIDREEAKIFGRNLGLSKSVIERFLNMSQPAVRMLMKYRGQLTHYGQKIVLITSLKAIGRQDLVLMLTST
ncbi:uncharacterized protein LOC125665632 [Ostrea edulis]|uniref:uncharacterized protein LOC125665632 n=1 Tax=Ostrea edulis TaxID=37623 RepID=UPI0024AFD502|nr:uncharacterized protein LOC125665632 [Ostrea edulis]